VNLFKEKGPLSVSEVARQFNLTQPTITHHLHYLKETGILSSRREGRQIFYFLNKRCMGKDCLIFSEGRQGRR